MKLIISTASHFFGAYLLSDDTFRTYCQVAVCLRCGDLRHFLLEVVQFDLQMVKMRLYYKNV